MRKNYFNLVAGVLMMIAGFSGCGEATEKGKPETGEIEWPEIVQEAKPWTRWWWHGSVVTEREITVMLEAYGMPDLEASKSRRYTVFAERKNSFWSFCRQHGWTNWCIH